MLNRSIRCIIIPILALLASSFSGAARAEILLFASWSPDYGFQSFEQPGIVDFNSSASGGKVFNFTTSAPNQRVVIVFEATCESSRPANGASVRILLNPAGPAPEAAVPPTNTTSWLGGAPFCHKDFGTQDFVSHIVRASITASTQLAQAGTHTVRVQVTPTTSVIPPTVRFTVASLTVLR